MAVHEMRVVDGKHGPLDRRGTPPVDFGSPNQRSIREVGMNFAGREAGTYQPIWSWHTGGGAFVSASGEWDDLDERK